MAKRKRTPAMRAVRPIANSSFASITEVVGIGFRKGRVKEIRLPMWTASAISRERRIRSLGGKLTSPACTSVRHNISKHCRLNNKAACTKRSIIDHQKNQTERDCCRKDEHGDSHRQPNFDMYHGQR